MVHNLKYLRLRCAGLDYEEKLRSNTHTHSDAHTNKRSYCARTSASCESKVQRRWWDLQCLTMHTAGPLCVCIFANMHTVASVRLDSKRTMTTTTTTTTWNIGQRLRASSFQLPSFTFDRSNVQNDSGASVHSNSRCRQTAYQQRRPIAPTKPLATAPNGSTASTQNTYIRIHIRCPHLCSTPSMRESARSEL